MRFFSPAGPRPDFRDRNPLIIHQETDNAFALNVDVAGFDYTVPANRNMAIEWMDFRMRLDETMGRVGVRNIVLGYDPAIGPTISSNIARFDEGDGPGTGHVIGHPGGLLLAGDRIVASMVHVSPAAAGNYTTSLHGVEYDA